MSNYFDSSINELKLAELDSPESIHGSEMVKEEEYYVLKYDPILLFIDGKILRA